MKNVFGCSGVQVFQRAHKFLSFRTLLHLNTRILVVMTIFMAIATSGCVKRAIMIDTIPQGASVWINENPVGKTPIEFEFITHGRYKFRIQKEGFRERVAREMVKAPVYQWIGLDFIFEILIPKQFNDVHHFYYVLDPQPTEERLVREAPDKAEHWMQILHDPDPAARRSAVVRLAQLRKPNTAEAVESLLRDPDPMVRAAAVHALRALKQGESLEQLLQILQLDDAPEVRWQAAVELEVLGDPAAVPGLIKALRQKDALVRGGAAEALKGIPDKRAVKPLVTGLRDKNAVVRRASAEALGDIGDKAAVAGLTRALFHHDVHLRRRSVDALAKLKDPASGRALVNTFTDWDPEVRRKATDALLDFGEPDLVPILIRRLRGWKTWTRAHAAEVLAGFKAYSAAEPLRKAFAREPDWDTKAIMADAIGAITGDRPAYVRPKPVVKDPDKVEIDYFPLPKIR